MAARFFLFEMPSKLPFIFYQWMVYYLVNPVIFIYLGTLTRYRFRRVSLFWFTKKKCREEDPGRQHTDNSLTILLKCMVCMAWYNLISLCTMQFWFFLRSWHRKLEIYTLHLVIWIAAFVLFYGCHLVQTIYWTEQALQASMYID